MQVQSRKICGQRRKPSSYPYILIFATGSYARYILHRIYIEIGLMMVLRNMIMYRIRQLHAINCHDYHLVIFC
ncbi:hypothetical protein RhiirC2_761277 [Rhizophagus irregularis]|uniref:Uncharacterized protein n=1 Tax=Rhizophagus irregularis TaxID=588596 RepID=A0A2N1MH20_9GLOM|nr:hypothetical protein RhiirC2_761277 [Rhizophagus irregularis]